MPKLKCVITSGKVSSSPNLSSMLGQRGINLVDFTKEAVQKTEVFIAGQPINCFVVYNVNKTNKNNAFSIHFGSVRLYEVFVFLADQKGINIRWLFVIAQKRLSDFEKTKTSKQIIRIFFGYVKTLQLFIYK